jgi:micrococcal nuclease
MGKNIRIRLLHVDCPEKDEPFYQVAKQYTAQLCFQKKVKIIHNNKYDRYGRLLAEVVLPDGRILNQELVKAGYAKHFKKYSSSSRYGQLEVLARSRKLGIWGL